MSGNAATRELVRILRPVVEPSPPAPGGEDTSSSSWSGILRAAELHGLSPLLHHVLMEFPGEWSESVSPDALSELQAMKAHNALRVGAGYEQLVDLLNPAADQGLCVVLLKGVYLGKSVYPDPALRPFADIDLLVPEQDRREFVGLLREMGYRPIDEDGSSPTYDEHHHLPPFHGPGPLPVEIHRSLGPRTRTGDRRDESVLGALEEVPVGGVTAHTLSPVDHLLHLCLHMAVNHRFRVPLLSFFDIGFLLRAHGEDMEPGKTVRRARELGVEGVTPCVLKLTEALTGVAVPERLRHRLGCREALDEFEQVVLDYVLDRSAVRVPAGYRSFRRQRGLFDRARVVGRTAFPDSDRLAEIYGAREDGPPSWVLRLHRPVSILIRTGGMLVSRLTRLGNGREVEKQAAREEAIERWLSDGMT